MITKEELIGKKAEIVFNNRSFKGIIVNETKNMISLKMEKKNVSLPKDQSVLKIQGAVIKGKNITKRPEDRIKAC